MKAIKMGYGLTQKILAVLICIFLSFVFVNVGYSQCVTGASAILYGQPCGEPDMLNLGSAGTAGSGVVGAQYKYSVTYQTPYPMSLQYIYINGSNVVPNQVFTYTGPFSMDMKVYFSCSIPCGLQRTMTITFKLASNNQTVCTKTYTFQAASSWLTASPSATNCSNVPVTVTINSNTGVPANCLYTIHNSNPSQWKINGSSATYYYMPMPGNSVTVTNTSGTNSTTTLTFLDGSLCYCCPHYCGTPPPFITLNSNAAPTANAGPDKYHCCFVTIGTPAQSNTSYSWSPTTGLNNPNIAQPTTWMTNITYTLTATSTLNGCTAQDQVYVGFQSGNCCRFAMGEENVIDLSLRVFPNPSSKEFGIDLSEYPFETVAIRVYDLLGSLIDDFGSIACGKRFDFGAGYQPGVYRVVIQDSEEHLFKIVKN